MKSGRFNLLDALLLSLATVCIRVRLVARVREGERVYVMANTVKWDDRGFPVMTSGELSKDGRWVLYLQDGPVALAPFKATLHLEGLRRIARDDQGRYCVAHRGKLLPLRKGDADEVDALKELFGDWVDPYEVRKARGETAKRATRASTFAMPDVLTGAEGEVAQVSQWPMTASQLWHLAGSPNDGQMTDCLLHLDKIRIGGTHNARRVRQHDGVTYIIVRGRCVPLGGELFERVNSVITCVFDSNKWADIERAEQEAQARDKIAERYDAQKVHDNETKC